MRIGFSFTFGVPPWAAFLFVAAMAIYLALIGPPVAVWIIFGTVLALLFVLGLHRIRPGVVQTIMDGLETLQRTQYRASDMLLRGTPQERRSVILMYVGWIGFLLIFVCALIGLAFLLD